MTADPVAGVGPVTRRRLDIAVAVARAAVVIRIVIAAVVLRDRVTGR
jgi:hypothetical protein